MDKTIIKLQRRKKPTLERIGNRLMKSSFTIMSFICVVVLLFLGLGYIDLTPNVYGLSNTVSPIVFSLVLLGSSSGLITMLVMHWEGTSYEPITFECEFCKHELYSDKCEDLNIKCYKCERLHVINWIDFE